MEALFNWMKNNGAIFPNLEYRNGGMFATEDIPQDSVLAFLPSKLVLSHTNGTSTNLPEMAALLRKVASEPDHFFRPYIESLPWACQTPHCGAEPWPALNLTATPLFKTLVVDTMRQGVNDSLLIEFSLALSRRWDFGMCPGLDLFNHKNDAEGLTYTANQRSVVLQANKAYKKGEEVFDSYGNNKGAAFWAATYNMQHSSSFEADSNCETQLSFYASETLRTNVTARVQCFASQQLSSANYEVLKETFMGAIAHNDLAAIKGLAQVFSKGLHLVN